MKFETIAVNSTAVRILGYSEENRTLRVIFNSGSGYDYHVDKKIFDQLKEADSVGKEYWKLIKKQRVLHFKKLENKEAMEFLLNFLKLSQNQKIFVNTEK